jgi:hypothetical protein
MSRTCCRDTTPATESPGLEGREQGRIPAPAENCDFSRCLKSISAAAMFDGRFRAIGGTLLQRHA